MDHILQKLRSRILPKVTSIISSRTEFKSRSVGFPGLSVSRLGSVQQNCLAGPQKPAVPHTRGLTGLRGTCYCRLLS